MQIEHCHRSTPSSRLGAAIDAALRCADDPDEALTRVLPAATVAAGAAGATLWTRHPDADGFHALATVGSPHTSGATNDSRLTVELGPPNRVLAIIELHGVTDGDGQADEATLADELRRLHPLAVSADALRRLRQLQSATAEAMHDLVDVLTLISGAADAILSDDDPRATVERIHACIEHAAQIAGGRRTRTEGSADIAAACDDIRRLLEPTFRPGAHLKVTVNRDLPRAAIDQSQLRQILVNLVLNARDAVHSNGTVTIAASPGGRPDANGQSPVRLTVHDTGPGITKADLPHIFTPFFTTKEHGTGLGLAAVRRIVTAHGGTIDVQSSPQGTRFTLNLPTHADPLRPDLRAATA